MCFNPPLSAAIAVAGFVVAGLLAAKGKPFRCYFMFIYFGLMEVLQLAQYAVIDQCDNPLNQALTMAAYVHTAFQPLVVNMYFFYDQVNPGKEITSFLLRMCLGNAILTLMRTPLIPIALLGDLVHTQIPDLPPSSTYGKGCHYMEPFCGEKLCSITGQAWGHVSWSIPLLPATYFIPSAFSHFFLFFVPVLIAGSWPKKLLMVGSICIGPLACMSKTSMAMETYVFEWATVWCFFAGIQGYYALVTELWLLPASWAPLSSSKQQEQQGKASTVKVTANGQYKKVA